MTGSVRRSTVVSGHALRSLGAPYDRRGSLVRGYSPSTAGVGRARCECGVLSEELPSAAARRRWHREHKREETAAATDKAQLDERERHALHERPGPLSARELAYLRAAGARGEWEHSGTLTSRLLATLDASRR